MPNFQLPKGYTRIDQFPLDDTSVFSSVAELDAYRVSPTAYAGQLCTVVEGGVSTAYTINADFSVTKIATGNTASGIDGGNPESIFTGIVGYDGGYEVL